MPAQPQDVFFGLSGGAASSNAFCRLCSRHCSRTFMPWGHQTQPIYLGRFWFAPGLRTARFKSSAFCCTFSASAVSARCGSARYTSTSSLAAAVVVRMCLSRTTCHRPQAADQQGAMLFAWKQLAETTPECVNRDREAVKERTGPRDLSNADLASRDVSPY